MLKHGVYDLYIYWAFAQKLQSRPAGTFRTLNANLSAESEFISKGEHLLLAEYKCNARKLKENLFLNHPNTENATVILSLLTLWIFGNLLITEKGVEKGALLTPSPSRFQLKSNSGRVETWRFFLPPIFLVVSLLFDFFEFLCVITLTMIVSSF